MKPLGLTDSQYSALVDACQPLAPADRGRFLEALAAALRNEPVIGDGVVSRAIRFAIKPYFRPPSGTAGPQAKWQNVGPPLE
jgi:hypothetical protein